MTNLIDIIREAGILDKVAFGDEDNSPKLARLQGAKPRSEKNNSFEDKLYDAISNWVASSTLSDKNLEKFQQQMPLLVKQYPQIFKPATPIGTILYRGLGTLSNNTLKYLIAKSTPADWVQMKEEFWLCKIPIEYKPHLKAQSWTDKINIAQKFSEDGLLVTKQDSSFYMNKKTLQAIYGENEHEIIHFGQEYANPVYIAVEESTYEYRIVDKIQPKAKKIGLKDLPSFYKSKKK